MNHHQILSNIVDSILKVYDLDDEYSVIAKMTFIEFARGLEGRKLLSYQHDGKLVALYKSKAHGYLSSFTTCRDEIFHRKVIKIAITSSKYDAPFSTTVTAISNISKELLHYGAIEFLSNFQGDGPQTFPPLHNYYDFSQIDPSWDDYRIFDVVIRMAKWKYYAENLFLEDKWQTDDCIRNVYRLVKNRINEVCGGMQENGIHPRIGSFIPFVQTFQLHPQNRMQHNELYWLAKTIIDVCRYIPNHERKPHRYLGRLINDVAINIPELLAYLHHYHGLKDFIVPYLKDNGIEYMRNAHRLKSIDAAIYAAMVSKSCVASYLLEIYDQIPNIEFHVDLDVIEENGKRRVYSRPFFSTVLIYLYDETSFEKSKILVNDLDWADGKRQLFKIGLLYPD